MKTSKLREHHMNLWSATIVACLGLLATAGMISAQSTGGEPVIFPAGDPAQGKLVFAERLCTACHTVSDDPDYRSRGELIDGPDLAMSSGKSIGFLATAIIAPSHQVDVDGVSSDEDEQFIDSEGNSLMPSVNESLTVAELIDLLAYLSSDGDTP